MMVLHMETGRQQTEMALSEMIDRIDAATERFCTAIAAMPLRGSTNSSLEFMATFYSADTKKSIMNSFGVECRRRDFYRWNDSGHLIRRNPDLDTDYELDGRAYKKVLRYADRMNRYADKLELKYASDLMILGYLRKIDSNSAAVKRALFLL